MTENLEEIEALVEALRRKINHNNEQIDELKETVGNLEDEVSVLRQATDTEPGSIEYERMSKTEKVREVRLAVLRRAEQNGGKAQMNYSEVRAVFNEQPSDGHVYNLMRAAGAIDGFIYTERNDGKKVIRGHKDGVNENGLIQSVNNGMISEGA